MSGIKRLNHRGCLYAARGVDTGRIKIGYSSNPSRRMRALKSEAGEPVELIGVSCAASKSQEYWTHLNYDPYSIEGLGEWYRPTPEILDLVERMDDPDERNRMTDKTQHLPDRLLDVEEAAEFLGLTEKALRRRVERDVIPYRKVGRLLRFDPIELYRWSDPNREDT